MPPTMLTFTTLALALLHITSCFASPFPVLNLTDSDIFNRQSAIKDHIKTRETLEIVWSCLATTFSCTWIAIHPNIEFHGHLTWSKRLFVRLYLMAVALITPEAMVLWAANQYFAARFIQAEVNKYIAEEEAGEGDDNKRQSAPWTMTHAHFLQMGGFRLRCTNDAKEEYHGILEFHHELEDKTWDGVLTYTAFMELLRSRKLELPSTSEEEINDRSKGDIIFKGLAIAQLLWFITQMIVRVSLHLDVTNIELTTTALIVPTFFMYVCWWSKPLDVHCPIILRFSDTVQHGMDGHLESEGHGSHNGDGAVDGIRIPGPSALQREQAESPAEDFGSAGTNECDLAASCSTQMTVPSQLQNQAAHSSNNTIDDLDTGMTCNQTSAPAEDALHGSNDDTGVGYTGRVETVLDHPLTPWHGIIRSGRRLIHAAIHILVLPLEAVRLFCLYTAMIPFYHGVRKLYTIMSPLNRRQDQVYPIFYAADFSFEHRARMIPYCSVVAFGVIFGGIHLAGWSFPFPTFFEQEAWRYATIIMCSPPVLFPIMTAVFILSFFLFHGVALVSLRRESSTWGAWINKVSDLQIGWARSQYPRLFLGLIGFSFVFIYIIARFGILIISLISLRKLPKKALQTVDWLEIFPHI